MKKLATIEFDRGNLSFSAGHFTIFSAESREHLHGHNYSLKAAITAEIIEPGITFDYRIFRNKLARVCKQLHTHLLLPTQSPYLMIEEDNQYYYAIFNSKKMPFLKEDVILMPLANITLEELSHWFIDQLLEDRVFIAQHCIHEITITAYNGLEHGAKAVWQAPD